jgi:hypothetical protein
MGVIESSLQKKRGLIIKKKHLLKNNKNQIPSPNFIIMSGESSAA